LCVLCYKGILMGHIFFFLLIGFFFFSSCREEKKGNMRPIPKKMNAKVQSTKKVVHTTHFIPKTNLFRRLFPAQVIYLTLILIRIRLIHQGILQSHLLPVLAPQTPCQKQFVTALSIFLLRKRLLVFQLMNC
jgi:hypothetical protein